MKMRPPDPAEEPLAEDPAFTAFVTAYEEALVAGTALPDVRQLEPRHQQEWQHLRDLLHLLHETNGFTPGTATSPTSVTSPDRLLPIDLANTSTNICRFSPPPGLSEAANSPLPDVPGYELLAEVGRGGMGVVYKARHRDLKRLVALKMILAGDLATPEQLLRFQIEAEMAARIRHPNVVVVHEVGRWRGRPFLAMEWIEGGTLAGKLRAGRLPCDEAARLVQTLAQAVHAAHCHGVVHRDLKPANVLLGRDGQPRLTDFGLARAETLPPVADARLTASGAIVGTPEYMAPEQASAERQIGPAADIHALGAVLYECLTGRPPFQAATFVQTVLMVQQNEPTSPRRIVADLPGDLETICLHCLRKDPDHRYASAEALAEDLRRFLAGEPITARPVGDLERARLWARRHPAVAGLLALTAVLLVGGTVVSSFFAWRSSQHAATAEKNQVQAEEEREAAGLARDAARANEKRAVTNEQLARLTLADLFTAQGMHADQEGERQGAALWFAEAARQAANHDHRRRANALRLHSWSSRVSRPVASLPCDVNHARSLTFHPTNRYLLITPPSPAPVPPAVWDVVEERRLVLPGSNGAVTATVWSPDGAMLAVGTADGHVSFCDFPSLTVRQVARTPTRVSHLRFSPEGRRVALVSDTGIRLWDLETQQFLGGPVVRTRAPVAVEFSPTGRHLAVASPGEPFWLLAANAGGLTHEWAGPPPPPQAEPLAQLLFSPDGKLLVTHDRLGQLTCWDLAQRRAARTFVRQSYLRQCAISPDGHFLAASWNDGLVLYSLHTGATIHRWQAPTLLRMYESLLFRPDGERLLTVSSGGLTEWSTRTGQPVVADLVPGPPGFRVATLSPDGQCVAVSHLDGRVRVWALPQPSASSFRIPGGDLYTQGEFSQDSRLLLVSQFDGAARVWRLDEQAPAGPPLRPEGAFRAGWFATESLVLTHSQRIDANKIHAGDLIDGWDWRLGRRVFPTIELPAPFSGLASHAASRRLAIVTGQGHVLLIDTDTGRPIWRRQVPAALPIVGFAADGHTLIVACRKPALVAAYESATGRLLYSREHGSPHVVGMWTMSRTAEVLALREQDRQALWIVDAATGERRRDPIRFPALNFWAEFSQDGRYLVTRCNDRLQRVWDVAAGRFTGVPLEISDEESLSRFLSDNQGVITATPDGRVDLWDWQLGQRLMPTHVAGILSRSIYRRGEHLQVSPDGRWAAVGGRPHLEVIRLPEVESPDAWSAKDLCTWAEVQSYRRVQEGGRLALLTPEEWAARWTTLRHQHLEGGPIRQQLAPSGVSARLQAQGLAGEAIRRLEETLRQKPSDGHSLRQLAQAYRRTSEDLRSRGRPREALSYQERAQAMYSRLGAMRPDDPELAGERADFLLEAAGTGWRILDLVALHSNGGATLTQQVDGTVLASGINLLGGDTYHLSSRPGMPGLLGLRLEALPDPGLPGQGPGRRVGDNPGMPRYDSGAFVLSRLRVHLTPADGKQSEIDLAEVVTDYAEPKLPNGASGDPQGILGRVPGVWSIYPHVGQPHCLLVKANRPFGGPEHATLTVILAFAEPGPGHNLGRFRLAVTDSLQTLAAERWRLLLAGTTVNGWVRLGVAHCLREQWAEALAALNKGVSDSPSDGAWSLFQALAAGKLGHRDEAQRHQQRGLAALRTSPPKTLLHQAARESLISSGDMDEAAVATLVREGAKHNELALLDAGVAAAPGKAAPLVARGLWLGRQGRWKEAARDLVEACKLEPADHYPWFLSATLLAHLADEEAYRSHRRKMLQQFSETRDAVIAERIAKVSLLLPAEGEDLKRAVGLAERARTLSGLSVPVALAVGLAELRQGRFDAALDASRSAGDKAPRSSFLEVTSLVIEALALAGQGKKDRCAAILEKVRDRMTGWPREGKDDLGPAWTDMLICRLLLRQAETLLPSKGPRTGG